MERYTHTDTAQTHTYRDIHMLRHLLNLLQINSVLTSQEIKKIKPEIPFVVHVYFLEILFSKCSPKNLFKKTLIFIRISKHYFISLKFFEGVVDLYRVSGVMKDLRGHKELGEHCKSFQEI